MRPIGPGMGIFLIVALSLVEIAIAFAIVFVATGWRPGFGVGIRHVDFTPRAIAPLAAGLAPRIGVDDGQSRVIVEPSNDGRVHVTDKTWFYGGVWSTQPVAQLQVRRTPHGVSISRPQQNGAHWFWFGIGEYDRAIEIDVPARTMLSVAHCAGARIDGLSGNIDVTSDDGRIEASNVHADLISLRSGDGRIMLNGVAARMLSATTDDGRIEVQDLRTRTGGAYDLMTHDGSIVLGFAGPPNATVAASTQDGNIRLDGRCVADGDIVEPIRLGNGSARVRATTDDGSIRIASNGAP
ncbi:MAG TPA: DUF4097 family beta strand repeat-containing protein [Candidatus Tyrphobacter sp.]